MFENLVIDPDKPLPPFFSTETASVANKQMAELEGRGRAAAL
jgi:hypothetical protein